MVSIRQSLILNLLSTNWATAVQFGVTVVLARLLSPEEVGIFSITAVAVSVAQLFRDFGVGSYLQQEKELTKEKVAAAFGVLLVSSWLIALAVFMLGRPLADFYGQPGICNVMQVMALGFVFIPFGAVTHALLTRDLRAKEQAYVRVAGTFAYAFAAICLALHGASYMSMAWANLVNIIVTALAYVPFRPSITPWIPTFNGARSVLRFGLGAMISNSINAMNNALPDMVLGKISGPHDVGLLSRATSTTNLLNQVIGPAVSYAVLPHLSRVHHSGVALRDTLLKGTAYITGLMWPALIATAVFAHPLLIVLYGEKWVAAAVIVQWVAAMIVMGVPFSFHATAYLAIGRPYFAIVPIAIGLVTRLFAIYILYDGSLVSFAVALFSASAVLYPVQAWLHARYLGVPVGLFLTAQSKSLLVGAVVAAFSLLVSVLTHGWQPLWILLASVITVIPIWFFAIWLARHPLRKELELAISKLTI